MSRLETAMIGSVRKQDEIPIQKQKKKQRRKTVACKYKSCPCCSPFAVIDYQQSSMTDAVDGNEDTLREFRRLMIREIPPVKYPLDHPHPCCRLCDVMGHFYFDCKYKEEIPPGTKLEPYFDAVCCCCGKIGMTCSGKKTRAVLKICYLCLEQGHWFWEDRCEMGSVHPNFLRKWNETKEMIQSTDKPSMQNEEDEVRVKSGKGNKTKEVVELKSGEAPNLKYRDMVSGVKELAI